VAIALEAFVAAAEAAGLGCCPISVIRNHAEEVSGLLGLPDHAFPVAGLGVGIPATPAFVSARLPLGLTVHRDRYTDATDALTMCMNWPGDSMLRNPITGIAGCCARAASGHATAPPSVAKNFRRSMGLPCDPLFGGHSCNGG
jgi:hypothetical protein